MDMYCRECYKKFETTLADAPSMKHCLTCGGGLRMVKIENGVEIFLESTKEDNVMASGHHLGCGGYTDINPTSSPDMKVHVCRSCYCRIYQNEGVG